MKLDTVDAFPSGSRERAWGRLVDADPNGTVFHTPRFLKVWWQSLDPGAMLALRFVTDARGLLGVVPEVRTRAGSVTGPRVMAAFAGGTDVTDYRGPVSRPEHRDVVVGAWLDALAEDRDWDDLVAGGLAADAGWHERLAEVGRGAGLEVLDEVVEDVCPRIDLSGGWQGYLGRLNPKQRHELRRKGRRLASETRGGVRLAPVAAEDLGTALDRFFRLNHASEGDKQRFFVDDRMRRFFGELARTLGPDGTLRIHELRVDGAVLASGVSFVHRGEWGLYNTAFDQTWGELAPGMVLVAELIRHAAEEGARVFDLLRGDEPYKYRFGAVDRALHRATMTRPGT